MNEATIDGILESMEDKDITEAAKAAKGGSLFGKVVMGQNGPYMDFRLIDSDVDERPPETEGWAYIGYYTDPGI